MQNEISVVCPQCGSRIFVSEEEFENINNLSCSCGYEGSGAALEALKKSHTDKKANNIVLDALRRFFSPPENF